jgi:hypothetical protein
MAVCVPACVRIWTGRHHLRHVRPVLPHVERRLRRRTLVDVLLDVARAVSPDEIEAPAVEPDDVLQPVQPVDETSPESARGRRSG